MIINCKQIETDVLDIVAAMPISKTLVARTCARDVDESYVVDVINHMIQVKYLSYDVDGKLTLGERSPVKAVDLIWNRYQRIE